MDIDNKIIECLKSMADDHMTTTRMLASLIVLLQENDVRYEPLNFACFCAFRKAFNLSIKQAMPIMGWRGFGSTISDSDLDKDIDSIIYSNV